MRRLGKPALFLLIFLIAAAFPARSGTIRDLKPTVVLVSIDGFRFDYLEKYRPPVLSRLAREGVRAKWMTPVFPTKTFPNHYSIVTGLYPDEHGIIENNMYDPVSDAVFGLGLSEELGNARWWGGEPIWLTARKQGRIAASMFWPGSEAPIGGSHPRYWLPYEHELPHTTRVDTVLGWLRLPAEQRPSVITLYFSDVDDAGHRSGPDGAETSVAIQKVDVAVGKLYDGLRELGIERKVHMIVVSDHGMAAHKMRDAIVLDEMFEVGDARRILWTNEFTQIFPEPGMEDKIYGTIKAKLPARANVYRRNEFPARFRFGRNPRIAPIVVVPEPGTIITTRERYERSEREGTLDRIRGGHGYDNSAVSMRAAFIGYGGKFKKNVISEPIEAVDVYGLMCRILKLRPATNSGDPHRTRGLLR
jgi:predicted AlkP superfamily pyrophosphatase or phosphodiesterase